MKLIEMPGVDSLDALLDAQKEAPISVEPLSYQGVDFVAEPYQDFAVEGPGQMLPDIGSFLAPAQFLDVDLQVEAQANTDLEQAFAQSPETTRIQATDYYAPYRAPDLGAPSQEPRTVLARAMRRITAGEPARQVLAQEAPNMAEAYRPALRAAAQQEGLAGKVFVWASAYPGCDTGEWNTHARQHAKTARYVVATGRCAECRHAQEGRCSMLQKEIVVEVPWKKALKAYQGLISATRTSTEGTPQQVLKTALQRDAGQQAPTERSPKPQARNALQAVETIEAPKAKTAQQIVNDRLVAAAQRFVKLGFLSQDEVQKDPRGALERGAYKASVQEAREYTGQQMRAHQVQNPDRTLTAREQEAFQFGRALRELQPLIRAGRLTTAEATAQLRAGKTAKQIWVASRLTAVPTEAVAVYAGQGIRTPQCRTASKAPLSAQDVLNYQLDAETPIEISSADTPQSLEVSFGGWDIGGLDDGH